jgi:hypothetical protein
MTMPDRFRRRPLEQKVALGTAVALFAIALVIGFFVDRGKLFGACVSLFVGIELLIIGLAGRLPPRAP